jgi:DNA-directed RNA polymerase subunit F
MKNIEQILKDAGLELTDEQKTSINAAVAENYKTVAEVNKITKKLEDSQTSNTSLQEQIDSLNNAIKKFDGVDVEKLNKAVEDANKRAEDAEKDRDAKLLQRDQRDALNAEFDKLGIKSDRTRKSLMADIMGEDGLKWKNNAFMGLNDYLAKENEKDHFYQTQEEKDLEAQQQKAAGKVPTFTAPTEGKPGVSGDKPLFNFGFTPIREVKK